MVAGTLAIKTTFLWTPSPVRGAKPLLLGLGLYAVILRYLITKRVRLRCHDRLRTCNHNLVGRLRLIFNHHEAISSSSKLLSKAHGREFETACCIRCYCRRISQTQNNSHAFSQPFVPAPLRFPPSPPPDPPPSIYPSSQPPPTRASRKPHSSAHTQSTACRLYSHRSSPPAHPEQRQPTAPSVLGSQQLRRRRRPCPGGCRRRRGGSVFSLQLLLISQHFRSVALAP